MKYFINEEERKSAGSTCYFEFQKGKHKNKHWLKDSIFIHADIFDKLLLFQLFDDSLGQFNYYGITNVIEAQWKQIVENSSKNEQWKIAIEQLMPWVEECFTKHNCFTICGI